MMIAQRYPDAFDGIAASAPAFYWNNFLFSDLWPTFVMKTLGVFPPACEFSAITDAVVSACDGLDGVVDGVVADIDVCNFDATSMVGRPINCSTFDTQRTISAAAATIMNAAVSLS